MDNSHDPTRSAWDGAEANSPVINGADGFRPASDLQGQQVPARKWLVPDLVPMQNVTLLAGDGGTGKSLLALQLATAAATGGVWLKRQLDHHGPAFFLSAEDDEAELHRRIDAVRNANALEWHQLNRLYRHSLAGEDALLAKLEDGAMKQTKLFDWLDRQLKSCRPTLLVLDTLADLFPGNENDRAQARQFIAILRRLTIRHGCAVVLVAHPSLSGMASGKGTSGSTAWNNSVRSRLYLERVTTQKGNTVIEVDPDRRILRCMKANYGPTGEEIRIMWRQSVFVADAQRHEPSQQERDAKAEDVFLRLLKEFSREGRHVKSSIASGYAPKVFAESGRAEGFTKKELIFAMNSLFKKSKIVERKDGVGPPSKQKNRIMLVCETPS